jgi:uncharacterized protein YjbI with pentapeptide repeats
MKRLVIGIALLLVGMAAVGAAATPANAQTMTNEANRNANREKVLAGAACKGCDLFQLDFSYKEITNRDLSGSRLRQSDFSVATMDGSKFSHANLSILEAYGARFAKADFSGADLSEASFVGAWLGGANLAGANLKAANFSGAYLKTARGLTQAQLNAACGDGETEMPAGMKIPVCK